ETAEFYLADAMGNTVGILDLNKGEWTWYVFGRDRFAKIKPDQSQQPAFYPLDNKSSIAPDKENTDTRQLIGEISNVLKSGGNTQTQLLKVQPVNSSSFWISENNLSTFTSTVPDNKYTITQEFNLKNTNQQVSVNNSLISIGALTGINKDKADNVIKLPG